MKETVLITGASGLIASHTVKLLSDNYEIKLLTRNPSKANEYKWDIAEGYVDEDALRNVDYIIHTAGAKLNDGSPLTPERQKQIWDTRIGASNLLLEKLQKTNQKLKAFISASALGYYSFADNKIALDENSQMGTSFEALLSDGWEKAADEFKKAGVADRVVKLRVSLVLGNEGGIFPMFANMLGGKPEIFQHAQGSTYFAWVHVRDMAGMFAFGVTDNKLDGVYNTTAPGLATKEGIFKKMYYLRQNDIANFEKVDASYKGQHLTSDKIIEAGYEFQFPDIDSALKNLML